MQEWKVHISGAKVFGIAMQNTCNIEIFGMIIDQYPRILVLFGQLNRRPSHQLREPIEYYSLKFSR